MKITELNPVLINKIGKVNKNGLKLESGEEKTTKYLTLFGFDIEFIKPTRARKVKNPDVLILGAVWEIKTPTGASKNTIKNRFRRASKQASKIIFDLRFVKGDAEETKKQILDLFKEAGTVRRMMIIEKDGRLFDIIK